LGVNPALRILVGFRPIKVNVFATTFEKSEVITMTILSSRTLRWAAVSLAFAAGAASAQMTPVGAWHTIDDKTQQPKALVVIADNGGVLTGRIQKVLNKDAQPGQACDKCSDDRKGRPIEGLEIIRGAKKAASGDVWEGGRILDPENGKDYTLRLTPVEGGQKLQVRGSIGPFWRTQVWQRAQ
jgi:uncharacterized protein (DUF2147 family)